MDEYRYEPLPHSQPGSCSRQWTRLATLAPGLRRDNIQCTLAVTDIQSAPSSYEALSYVWGKAVSPSPIFCDGKKIAVTSNLQEALQSLRSPIHPRRLWIDAICIDQKNDEERSQQVQIMRLIYKHANRVVVWLGPKSDGIEHAFELARRLSELRREASLLPPDQHFASDQESVTRMLAARGRFG